MVVTRSREHALRLYQAMRKYVDQRQLTDCAPLVAFSGSLTIDGQDYTESKLNGFSEAALLRALLLHASDNERARRAAQRVNMPPLFYDPMFTPYFTEPFADPLVPRHIPIATDAGLDVAADQAAAVLGDHLATRTGAAM